MNDRLPLAVRLRCAARAAWACLRGDYTVQRIPRPDRTEVPR